MANETKLELKNYKKGAIFWHFSKTGVVEERHERGVNDMESQNFILGLSSKNCRPFLSVWGNSVYMAHKKEVALGYADAPGRLYQLEVVEPLNYVDSQEDDYASGTVTSNDLPQPTADFVNQTLGFDKRKEAFMVFLGYKEHAFECFHDCAHNRELIVPVVLMNHFRVVSIQDFTVDYATKVREELNSQKKACNAN